MGSMTTKVYINNNMAVSTKKNGSRLVNSSTAATKLLSNHNDLDNNNGSNPQ